MNERNFKASDSKLIGVLRNVYNSLKVEIIEKQEVAEMQKELDKVQRGVDLDDSRESIVIEEENEANKSIGLDMSEEIIPEQPTRTTQKSFDI